MRRYAHPHRMPRPGRGAIRTLWGALAMMVTTSSAAAADMWSTYDWMARSGENPAGYWSDELTLMASRRDDDRGLAIGMDQLRSRAGLEWSLDWHNTSLAGARWTQLQLGGAVGFSPTFRLHWRPLAVGLHLDSLDGPARFTLDDDEVIWNGDSLGSWVGTEARLRVNQHARLDARARHITVSERDGVRVELGLEWAVYDDIVAVRAEWRQTDETVEPTDGATSLGVRVRL